MLLVCMITTYGIRNGPKNTTCASTGMAWDSVIPTARLFTVKLLNPPSKWHRWTIKFRDMLLRLNYFGFLCHIFLITDPHKRLVTTTKGWFLHPCSWSHCFLMCLPSPTSHPSTVTNKKGTAPISFWTTFEMFEWIKINTNTEVRKYKKEKAHNAWLGGNIEV